MEKTIAAFDARRQFGKVLRDVETRGDSFVVERHGEPVAAVVPLHVYENAKRKRERLFELIKEAQENSQRHSPDMTEEEAMELALEAVTWARAERRKAT
ncbi:MAG: type II toxin-antitoxin system Phd/YefM family antitoxin [Chloroflexia bacterium]|jgi:prevent-host-death family protein|nr:type II toxin-antitoxin system Phd/YefM family antitoxin [Chloroflexia bacterium]